MFECKICDRSFTSRYALDKHKASSSKPHPSCEECKKRFSSTHAYLSHMVTKHPGVPYLTSNFDAPRYQNPPKAEVRAPPQLLIETSSPVSTKSTAWTPMDGFRLLYDCEWITYRGILGQSAPIIPNKSTTHTSQNGDSYSFKCGFCKKGTLVRPTAIPQCGHLFCYSCIASSLFRQPACPVCRKDTDHGSLRLLDLRS